MEPKMIETEVVGPCQNSGIYCMGSTLGHFGGGRMTHFFPTEVWIHTLRHLCATFIDFGAKMESTWDSSLAQISDHFRSNFKKVPKGVQSPTPDLKKVPPGAKMEATWSPGRPKVNGLGVKM